MKPKNNNRKPRFNKEDEQGLKVIVYDNNVEQALRRLKKKVANDGIMQTIRERKFFVSNTEKRLQAEARAKHREKKKRDRDNW